MVRVREVAERAVDRHLRLVALKGAPHRGPVCGRAHDRGDPGGVRFAVGPLTRE